MSLCYNCYIYNCCTIITVPNITSDVICYFDENNDDFETDLITFTVSCLLIIFKTHAVHYYSVLYIPIDFNSTIIGNTTI